MNCSKCLQILGKDLFNVVKEKYGPNLNLILEKITIVNGDIGLDDLGLHHIDPELEHQMVH